MRQWDVARAFNRRLKQVFDARGIEFAHRPRELPKTPVGKILRRMLRDEPAKQKAA